MRELVECFQSWLNANPSDLLAHRLLGALAEQTRRTADRTDPEQRWFDPLDVFIAAGDGEDDFERAKTRFNNARVPKYLTSRSIDLEDWFRQHGFDQGLRLKKTETKGKHRAQWYLEPYELPSTDMAGAAAGDEPMAEPASVDQVIYDFSPPGTVKTNWFGSLWFKDGRFETRSPVGLAWLTGVLVVVLVVILELLAVWGMSQQRRPVELGDLATLLLLAIGGVVLWRQFVRPSELLVEDRIRPAPDALLALKEAPAQIEFSTDGDRRVVQIVRYSARCPICAGDLELSLGEGERHRRLFGRCRESPQEHAYTFDRVTRRGRRAQ